MPIKTVVDHFRVISRGAADLPQAQPEDGPPSKSPAWGPAAGAAPVFECAGGVRAWLDPADARTRLYLDIVEDVSRALLPASMLVDEHTHRVVDVDVPVVGKVGAVRRLASGDLQVRVQPSCAVHVLRTSHPDFERLSHLLNDAREHDTTIALTEADEDHEVTNVAAVPQVPFDLQSAAIPAAEAIRPAMWTTMTRDRAEELFDAMLGRRCDPMNSDCIPFAFPDDGCHARAHRMCELMLREHETRAGKVWLFGELFARTRNHQKCGVHWIYHVAPVVNVGENGGVERMVIDPSLFKRPVAVETWKRAQGDPSGQVRFTEASIWDQPPDGRIVRDADFSRTPRDLVMYRNRLKRRMTKLGGPPPYCHGR